MRASFLGRAVSAMEIQDLGVKMRRSGQLQESESPGSMPLPLLTVAVHMSRCTRSKLTGHGSPFLADGATTCRDRPRS